MRRAKAAILILMMCLFARVTNAEVCTELIGSWTVQYSDQSQSTWVINGTESYDSSVFPCYATGVKQSEEEADVDFSAYSHENDRQIPFKVTNNYSFKVAIFSI